MRLVVDRGDKITKALSKYRFVCAMEMIWTSDYALEDELTSQLRLPVAAMMWGLAKLKSKSAIAQ